MAGIPARMEKQVQHSKQQDGKHGKFFPAGWSEPVVQQEG